MNLVKNDKLMRVRIECDNNKQFKKIRRGFRTFFVGLRMRLTYHKVNKHIIITTHNQKDYDEIFESLSKLMLAAKNKGQLIKQINIKTDDY